MTPLWQTTEWEGFQKALGHKTTRVAGELMVIHPLFLGLKYGYIPRGPTHNEPGFDQVLDSAAEKYNLVFTRIDPELAYNHRSNRYSKESHSNQPETTLVLDLTLTEKELLEQMKRKGRYNINLAQKKGVVVRRGKNEERKEFCHQFYKVLRETTQRDVFAGHEEKHYLLLLENVPFSEIFIASYEGEPISGAICTLQNDRAIYYYGASGNRHREVMAPYLVQWEAILEAKRRGCKSYDFLGIAPEDAAENHPWKGITEFKRKFGGTVVHYPKPIDIIHRPFWYTIYKYMKFLQNILRK